MFFRVGAMFVYCFRVISLVCLGLSQSGPRDHIVKVPSSPKQAEMVGQTLILYHKFYFYINAHLFPLC